MEMLTVKEVAEILKVDVETVRRLIYRKELKAYKVTSDWRIKQNELNEYIQKRSNFE